MTDQEIVKGIIKAEGTKYTNHPEDRGGPTKYGITLQTLSEWRDKPCTASDVENMKQDEAEAIYHHKYISPFSLLPEPIRETAIHCGVLRGPRSGIMMLQGILNVTVDGYIGNETIGAIKSLGPKIWNNLLVGALLHHFSLEVKKDSKQKKFRNGWQNRGLSFVVK